MNVCLIRPIRLLNKLLLTERRSKLTDWRRIITYFKSTDVIHILCHWRRVSSLITTRVTSIPESKCCGSHWVCTWKNSKRNIKFLVFINKPLSLTKWNRNHFACSITFFLRMTPYFIQTLCELGHKKIT